MVPGGGVGVLGKGCERSYRERVLCGAGAAGRGFCDGCCKNRTAWKNAISQSEDMNTPTASQYRKIIQNIEYLKTKAAASDKKNHTSGIVCHSCHLMYRNTNVKYRTLLTLLDSALIISANLLDKK